MTPDAIRHLRATLNLTQLELARRLGVSIDTIKAWESGRRSPAADKVRRMAVLLQTARLRAARLSDSLDSAAALADANAAAARADGDPEGVVAAQRMAATLRRLADTHRQLGATDPLRDPAQIA